MWPKCLPEALYTMRCSPDTLLGDVSPFGRVFTREPYTRITTWIGNPYERAPNQEIAPLNPDEDIEVKDPDDDIIEEMEEALTVARKEQVQVSKKFPAKTHLCTYQKIPAENGKTHYLQEVACIQMYDDIEQLVEQGHDTFDISQQIRERANVDELFNTHLAAARRHDDNARAYLDKRPVYYVPIVDELVDITRPTDVNSPDNRKLKNTWFGPYRVVSVAPHGKTCIVEQLNMPSLTPAKRVPKRVAVEDVKPCTSYRMIQRPRGEDFKPPWIEDNEKMKTEEEENDEVDVLDSEEEPEQKMLRNRPGPSRMN